MLLSVIFMDLARFGIKLSFQLNPDLSPMQNAFAKFFFMTIISGIIGMVACRCSHVLCSIPRHMLPQFFLRCFVFTFVSLFQAFGIKLLTYSTSVILSFIAPLLVPFTAFLILR